MHAARLRDACAQPRDAQARELPPERTLRQCQILSQIEVSRGGSPDLAARGLRNSAGLHEHYFVRRTADNLGCNLLGVNFQGRLRRRVDPSVSAKITTRSVPEAGSVTPKAATPFLRKPGMAPTASSISCGAMC